MIPNEVDLISRTPELAGLLVPLLALALACGPPPAGRSGRGEGPAPPLAPGSDPHSFARPEEAAVRHLALDLGVDFEARVLRGRASLTLERSPGSDRLVLDTRDLEIDGVALEGTGVAQATAAWSLGQAVEPLGRPLVIPLAPDTEVVHVDYRTSPGAAALQWLDPGQTAGGEHPFLLTQSQAILARTWIPLQDSPAVRFTYEATVRVPPELLAVMSAANPTRKNPEGLYRFAMSQAIPSYLMALAVGDLAFRSLGPASGVYAEPGMVEAAAWELAETPRMIAAAEALYGPYRWGRYDVLVLPPSFPFGGMENPRLTFATPTILAGDRSLTALVAHELAHSWSGNLVTNADWNDFWLNEGFTTYAEMRIMEEVYGRPYAEMLAELSLQDLRERMAELGPEHPDTHLHLDLAGRDPDDGMSSIAYDKGYLFLRTLEEAVGRRRWDPFLRSYFERFAFRSMDSAGFLAYLHEHLPEASDQVDLQAWVYGPGLPPGAALPDSEAFDRVEAQIAAWREGRAAAGLETSGWTTHEWLHFLRNLPEGLAGERLAELDRAFGLTGSGNAEIQAAWLEVAVREGYEPAYPALEQFLQQVGRRKFLRPLYKELAATPQGMERARKIYAQARPGYHAVSRRTVDELLEWTGENAGGG